MTGFLLLISALIFSSSYTMENTMDIFINQNEDIEKKETLDELIIRLRKMREEEEQKEIVSLAQKLETTTLSSTGISNLVDTLTRNFSDLTVKENGPKIKKFLGVQKTDKTKKARKKNKPISPAKLDQVRKQLFSDEARIQEDLKSHSHRRNKSA